ncbi:MULTISPECIES: sulfotransferase family 2 domain-containing protein [unclassified Ruegeria]|uniref:sulfotransferase family 2 domain-containing protein n=1 Tax=unclassified Ruegeria TaxID=2625375 RepID=UPI001492B6EC|nr:MULTISPECIES: sulfotransferase family 2 domain-containing protein [unclassified Ruegeria]NOD36583.1 sulfotransferase family 2 domain-containing protein [Ruegeria sp. HKCCD7296]NOE43823.1 sulfotransferase family 2 domain-containing protein [Ruegeria sp. HKCCD7319]
MAVISEKLKAVYFDITKVGSSSLKEMLWELDSGTPFKGRGMVRIKNNIRWRLACAKLVKPRNIHEQEGYQTQKFSQAYVPEEYVSFALVRDPLARIKSAWRDKIHQKQFQWRDEEMDIRNEGLPLNPSFGEFIDNFHQYRAVSRPARIHTTPYDWHLGGNIEFFDHVFKLEELSDLYDFISERLGCPLPGKHANKSPIEKRDDQLKSHQVDALLKLTKPDYDLLGGLYDQETAAQYIFT